VQPGSTARAALDAELARLRRSLPKVPAKVAVLDRWLRAHLLAQRLEDLCAQTVQLLGVDEARFARTDAPFLGMRSRLVVLVFADAGGLARYWKGCVDLPFQKPRRHWFKSIDSLLFATAESALGDNVDDDRALHAHLVHYVAQNLILGIGGITHELPTWIQVGYGQWLARAISSELAPGDGERFVEGEVLRLAQSDRLPRAETQLYEFEFDEVKTSDFPTLWSRFDFLASLGKDKLGRFLVQVKRRLSRVVPAPRELVLESQGRALAGVYGLGMGELDERWRAYVLRVYPGR
jgi:hypothetical protein